MTTRTFLATAATAASSLLLVLVLALAANGCGDSTNPNPNPPRNPQQPAAGLSASFVNKCARCHGERGEGQTVGDNIYPRIPNGQDESAFIAIVRAGRGDMPAFAEAEIPDADIKADYVWLTTKR